MKLLPATLIALTLATGAFAQDAEDPYADAVESRHGLMLLMADQLTVLGGMAKGEAAYDQAVATKAADNLAALASVVGPEQFPAGSEYQASQDSFALPAVWTNPDDFVTRITALNVAATAMQAGASTDLAGIQAAMGGVGAACGGCHKVYRQPEE